jgi:hypothetical protein
LNEKSFVGKFEVEEWGEKFEIPYSGCTLALKMMINDLNISNKHVIVGGINKKENNGLVYILDLENKTFELKKNSQDKFISRNYPLALISHNNLHVIGGFLTSIKIGNFVPQVQTKVYELNELEVLPLKEVVTESKIIESKAVDPKVLGAIPKTRLSVSIYFFSFDI